MSGHSPGITGSTPTEFPEMTGLSRSNLHYMRQMAAAWPADEVVPQPVGQLPWGHIRCLLDKLDDPAPRLVTAYPRL